MATTQLARPALRAPPSASSVSCALNGGATMTTRPAPALRAHMLKACGEAHAESLASFMALSVSVCRTKGGNSGAGKRGRGTGWRHRQGGIVVRAVNGGGSDAVVIPNEPLDVEAMPDLEKVKRSVIPPVVIGVATALYSYPRIIPWARSHLAVIRASGWAPVHVGIRAVDTWLALLVAFYEDAAAYDWGALALFYSSALLLSWSLAAAVESARLDAARARLVQYFSALAPVAMFLGPGVFVPIGWVVPYLRMPGNTTPGDRLPTRLALAKTVPTPVVRALNFAILLSSAVYFITRFRTLNPVLLLGLPLLWQLAAAPPAPWLGVLDAPVIGHRAAEHIHSFAAGIGMAQHISSVMALVQNPRMLADMARAFIDPPMRARPAVFVAANALGLWAALLTIPLAQEGRDAALRMLLISALFGPAAAVSLYFANREAAIERRVAQAEGLAVEIAVQSLQE